MVPLPEYGGMQVQLKSVLRPISLHSALGSHGLEEHGSGAKRNSDGSTGVVHDSRPILQSP